MIKYIFFDFGDTLIDMSSSKEALYSSLKKENIGKKNLEHIFFDWEKECYKLFEEFNKNKKFYTIKKIQEISLTRVLFRYKIKINDQKVENIINSFWEFFADNAQLYDGVISTLSKLAKGNYVLGLITDSDEETINKILDKQRLTKFFKIKIISSNFKIYKPNMSLYKKALEEANCMPEEAIYIGDSFIDIYGAKKLKMKTLIINRNKKIQYKTIDIEPEYIIDDLSQIIEIIKETEI